jgi:hypothetical protein
MYDKIKQFSQKHKLRRFSHLHRHLRDRTNHGLIGRWLSLLLGGICLFLGLIMLITPGPGLVFIILGLACLTLNFPRLARWLDRLEIKLRRLWKKKP